MKLMLKNEKGGVLIILAVVMPLLILIATSSVDFTEYQSAKSRFSEVIDNALLSSVATGMTKAPNETAREFYQANLGSESKIMLQSLAVTAGPKANEWTINAEAKLKTSFGSLTTPSLLKHTATVKWDTKAKSEVVFTIDTSASMCTKIQRKENENGAYVVTYEPDPTCAKLEAMKKSLLYVLENGFAALESVGGPTYKVGIVPFNHKVKLPVLGKIPSPLSRIEITHAKGSDNYYTNFDDAEPLSAVYPLTAISKNDDITQLKNHISSIVQNPKGNGWTRSNIGAMTAGLMLDQAYNNGFGGERPDVFNSASTQKYIVMMTDGVNMGCCYATYPEGNYDNQYLYMYEVDNAHLTGLTKAPKMTKWKTQYGIPQEGLCDFLKKNGVTIYSVVFDVDDRDAGGREIKEVYKSCASNDQFFFDVSSNDDLILAYKTIAQSFVKLRLVK